MILQTNIAIRSAKMRIIRSIDQPLNPRQGDVWIKTTLPVQNVVFTDNINPSEEQSLANNTIYFFSSVTGGDPAAATYKLFDFGNNLIINRDVACFILTNSSGMQALDAEASIYDVSSGYTSIERVQLPLIVSDEIDLYSFLGNSITIPSLFESLGIIESASGEAIIENNSEIIDFNSFLGTAVVISSLFASLGMAENLTIFAGGDQVYPPLE